MPVARLVPGPHFCGHQRLPRLGVSGSDRAGGAHLFNPPTGLGAHMGPEPKDGAAGCPHGSLWGSEGTEQNQRAHRSSGALPTPRVGLRSREGPAPLAAAAPADQQVNNPQPRPAGELTQDRTFRPRDWTSGSRRAHAHSRAAHRKWLLPGCCRAALASAPSPPIRGGEEDGAGRAEPARSAGMGAVAAGKSWIGRAASCARDASLLPASLPAPRPRSERGSRPPRRRGLAGLVLSLPGAAR